MQGIYVEEIADRDDEEHKPKKSEVRWVKQADGDDDLTYYGKVITEAKQKGRAVVYRRGGGSCLGIKDERPDKITMKKWLAKGVPWWWGSQELEEMLKE